MNAHPRTGPRAGLRVDGPADERVAGRGGEPSWAGRSRAELDAAIATLSAAHRDMIGPRRPGMICRGGWGDLTYRVDDVRIDTVQLGPDEQHPPSVRVLIVETDLQGPAAGRRRVHCTRWDEHRDRVLADPYTVAVGHDPVSDTLYPAAGYGALQQVQAAARPGDGVASWINDTATVAHTPGGPTTVRIGPEDGGVVEVSTSIEGGQVQIVVMRTGRGRPDASTVPIRISLNGTEILNDPRTE